MTIRTTVAPKNGHQTAHEPQVKYEKMSEELSIITSSSKALMVIHLDRWFNHRGRSCLSVAYIAQRHLIPTLRSELSTNRIESWPPRDRHGCLVVKVREWQSKSMDHKFEIVQQIRAVNTDIVDPHRRKHTTAAADGHCQRLARKKRRKHRRWRQGLKLSELEKAVRHDVEFNVVDIGVAANVTGTGPDRPVQSIIGQWSSPKGP